MEVRSLACRTDLIFPRFDGRLVDRGEYMVVESPKNPGFFFGSYLLYSRSPGAGDFDEWLDAFEREFRHNPRIKHRTFLWDGVDGESGYLERFVAAGFDFEKSVVLTAQRVRAPKKTWNGLVVRPLETDSDWSAAIENQIACRQERFDAAQYRVFKERHMARYRSMAEAGLGTWFGAFHGPTLVADLGIFFDGSVGRFQSVGTHPEYRRQGACGTLVQRASELALRSHPGGTLVMVADPDYHARAIYESVGFRPTELQTSMYWFDRDNWTRS